MLRTHSLSYMITFIKNTKSTSFKVRLEEVKAHMLLQKGQSKGMLSYIQSILAEQRFARTRYIFKDRQTIMDAEHNEISLHSQRHKEQDDRKRQQKTIQTPVVQDRFDFPFLASSRGTVLQVLRHRTGLFQITTPATLLYFCLLCLCPQPMRHIASKNHFCLIFIVSQSNVPTDQTTASSRAKTPAGSCSKNTQVN